MSRFKIKEFLRLFADTHKALGSTSYNAPVVDDTTTMAALLTKIKAATDVKYSTSGNNSGGMGSSRDVVTVSGTNSIYEWKLKLEVDTQTGCSLVLMTNNLDLKTKMPETEEHISMVFGTDKGAVSRIGRHTADQLAMAITVATKAASLGLFDCIEETTYLALTHKPY